MRFFQRNSIRKKIVLLSSIGVAACFFLLITGLISLRLMDRIVCFEEALHEHTVLYYQSLLAWEGYVHSGKEEVFQEFEDLTTRCMEITDIFTSMEDFLQDQSVSELADYMNFKSEAVDTTEARDFIYMVRFMGSNPLMSEMLRTCEVSTELDAKWLVKAREYRDTKDPAMAGALLEEIQGIINGLSESKLQFGQAVSSLSKWTTGLAKKVIIAAFFVFSIVSILLSMVLGRSLTGPILRAVKFADYVGDGNLDKRLTVDSTDETKELGDALNRICENLQKVLSRIMEGSVSIAEMSQDLSATSNQFAASATETSASVSEITVTTEQLKQIIQDSVSGAEGVMAFAEKTMEVFKNGQSATREVGTGMDRINSEVLVVAESIANLGEQTVKIAEIIDLVDELAQQSELLSVNASVEAAKAGEYGLGFQVVASEVKALSDQSKNATRQVRSILKTISSAADKAIRSAETSSESVQQGLGLNSQASKAIDKLEKNIQLAVDFTKKILATQNQELLGVNQVSGALGDIKDATLHNSQGASQLESKTNELVTLGRELKTLASRFNV